MTAPKVKTRTIEHGLTGRSQIGAGQRYTVKGLTKQAREDMVSRRVARALRRIGFRVADIAERDAAGIRQSGACLRASLGGYRIDFVIVLPGRAPDYRQALYTRSNASAVCISSAADAVRIATVGIVSE